MIKGALNIFRCTACVFTVMLAACSSTKELRPGPKELIILLAGEDGKTGAVAVGEGGSAVILDSPLATAEVDVQGHITKGVATEEEIKRIFAPALAAQPPKPEKFILYFLYFDVKVSGLLQSDLTWTLLGRRDLRASFSGRWQWASKSSLYSEFKLQIQNLKS